LAGGFQVVPRAVDGAAMSPFRGEADITTMERAMLRQELRRGHCNAWR